MVHEVSNMLRLSSFRQEADFLLPWPRHMECATYFFVAEDWFPVSAVDGAGGRVSHFLLDIGSWITMPQRHLKLDP